MVDITDGGPHGALRAAKSIHRRTGSPAGVREVPLAVVDIVEIRASIVGDVNILITVIVEIRENHTKPSAWILSGYSRGLADIREGAIAVVMVKEVLYHNNRSEEHTSELQSRPHLVCRLLLVKKKVKSAISVLPS